MVDFWSSEENEEMTISAMGSKHAANLSHLSLEFLHGSQFMALRARFGAGGRGSAGGAGERGRECLMRGAAGKLEDVDPGSGLSQLLFVSVVGPGAPPGSLLAAGICRQRWWLNASSTLETKSR